MSALDDLFKSCLIVTAIDDREELIALRENLTLSSENDPRQSVADLLKLARAGADPQGWAAL